MSYHAISPIDGRYAAKTSALSPYLSEWALMKYRLTVELRWLAFMSACEAITHLRTFSPSETNLLDGLIAGFDDEALAEIKRFEAKTNHDLKAVEYFLKSRLKSTSLADVVESVHFACTSDDINNLAYALMIRDALRDVWQPRATTLLRALDSLARANADAAMIGRTHGQAATPTTMGKELVVFVFRMKRQLDQIDAQEYLGKFNGAVGAYNAHVIAYPEIDWPALSRQFVESLGLSHNPLTTQIEPHDYLAELAHKMMRFNSILLDCCRDIWHYISLGYFVLKPVGGEIGSSTMPHKVNPIDFENAEANLGISNALLGHLTDKLPVSRLQRDLSDSSAMRNFGVAIAHGYLALLSAARGLGKIELNRCALLAELDESWELLGEVVQTILRKHHIAGAYEKLKSLTRGEKVSGTVMRDFINSLPIPIEDKDRLLRLTPATYVGLAESLALSEIEIEE